MNITFIFPRHIFPNNLGDTVNATIVPKVLKAKYPDSKLTVITDKPTMELLKGNKHIDFLRELTTELKLTSPIYYKEWAFNYNGVDGGNTFIVYPEWHPNIFSFWNKNHEFLMNHSTANIITVNYLMQLNATEYLFNGFDLREEINIAPKIKTEKVVVGIVPATKLSGKQSPHPGCNGTGYRYKLEFWKIFCDELLNDKNIEIIEFGDTNNNLGTRFSPPTSSFLSLAEKINEVDIGVMSDGGLHHIFNALNKPTVLFTATLINKAEFFKLGNSYYPEHLHLPCRLKCRSYFTEVFGGEDLSKACKLECENLDPYKLAEYTRNIINGLFSSSSSI